MLHKICLIFLLFSHVYTFKSLCTFVVCTIHCWNVHKLWLCFSTIQLFHQPDFSYFVNLGYFSTKCIYIFWTRKLQNNIRKHSTWQNVQILFNVLKQIFYKIMKTTIMKVIITISVLSHACVCQLCIPKVTVELAYALCRSRISAEATEIQNGCLDKGLKIFFKYTHSFWNIVKIVWKC